MLNILNYRISKLIQTLIFIGLLFSAGCQSVFSGKMFSGNSHPVTRFIGWNGKGYDWHAVNLSANFEHEKFNLTNFKSNILINSEISAVIRNDRHTKYIAKPFVRKVYISQRYINEGLKVIGLIEIIPIISEKFNVKNKNEKVEELVKRQLIKINIKEPIRNRNFGRNYYRIKLGEKFIDLETSQKK